MTCVERIQDTISHKEQGVSDLIGALCGTYEVHELANALGQRQTPFRLRLLPLEPRLPPRSTK